MARRSTTLRLIYAAMAGNCLVAVTKFVAGTWTGGSAIIAEGVHSLVDTGNQALLLYGLRRAERRPTPELCGASHRQPRTASPLEPPYDDGVSFVR